MTLGFADRRLLRWMLGLALGVSLSVTPAPAATFTTLYQFTGGTTGSGPISSVVEDSRGTLYGETVLHNFTGGTNGANPSSLLILPKDSVIGTTSIDGKCYYCGTIWEYTP